MSTEHDRNPLDPVPGQLEEYKQKCDPPAWAWCLAIMVIVKR